MDRFNWVEGVREGIEHLSPATLVFISLVLLILFISDVIERVFKPSSSAHNRSLFFVLYEYNVRRVYHSQEKTSHDTLYRGVESILRPGVSRPCVISLVSVGRGAACSALSLAHSLAAVIMQLLNPFGPASPYKYTIRGRFFTSADDYWQFNSKVVTLLSKYRVAVLTEFESLHPQVATVLTTLANETTLPQPQSLIIVILDTGERFNVSEKTKVRQLGQTAIQECLGPFLESREVENLVDTLTWRACLVLNEPSHRPSTCKVCNPPNRSTFNPPQLNRFY